MSSVVSRPFAQNKNNYVAMPYYYNAGTIESYTYLIAEDDVNQWVLDNADILTVFSNMYLTSVENYPSLVGNTGNGIWSYQYYTLPNGGYVAPGIELKNMGKEIFVGVPGEPNLLHLRLVQMPSTVENLGKGGVVGYAFVEGNATIFVNDKDNYPVISVARL